MPVVSPSCYELLGVPADAPGSLLEWSRAQRRREASQRLGELAPVEVDALVARIDEAFRILADPGVARRYRLYRSQLDADHHIGHPEDLAATPSEDDDDDTLTSDHEWQVEAVFDEEDDIELQKTQGAAPAFSGALGLLAEVVLAAPAPGQRRAGRRYPTRGAPPWLDVDPPEPAALPAPTASFRSVPGSSIPAPPGPDPSGRHPTPETLPPWEDRIR